MRKQGKVIVFTTFLHKPGARQKKSPNFLDDAGKASAVVATVGGAEVPAETVRENLLAFSKLVDSLVPRIDAQKNGFRLKAFDVKLGIDGKGQVGFLGTGIEVGGNATFTLRFER